MKYLKFLQSRNDSNRKFYYIHGKRTTHTFGNSFCRTSSHSHQLGMGAQNSTSHIDRQHYFKRRLQIEDDCKLASFHLWAHPLRAHERRPSHLWEWQSVGYQQPDSRHCSVGLQLSGQSSLDAWTSRSFSPLDRFDSCLRNLAVCEAT